MITTTLLIVLGVLLVFVLWRMKQAPSAPQLPQGSSAPQPLAAAAPDLRSARPGDVVSIQGAAEDFSDVDFTIDRRSAYQTGERRWIDLSGEFRGNRVYLEVQPGPETEVLALIDPRRMTIADVGTTEEQLAEMDAKQNPWLYLEWEGRRWQYESSRELGYFENEQGTGEGLYRWTFREKDGPRALCIEKWAGEPFDVRIARRLNPQDINIYRAA